MERRGPEMLMSLCGCGRGYTLEGSGGKSCTVVCVCVGVLVEFN